MAYEAEGEIAFCDRPWIGAGSECSRTAVVLLRGGQSSSVAKITYCDVAPVTIFPSHWIMWQWQGFSLEKPYVLCFWAASSAAAA